MGVDLNTSSHALLSYVAGINSSIAKNIVAYREENGEFTDRKELLKVPKLGKKAYEQCAGFLRVRNGKNPLDNTAVHPESYDAAMKLISECGFSLADISAGKSGDIKSIAEKIGIPAISKKLDIGVPTLRDIVSELQKPGRDLRDELPPPLMRSGDIMEIGDLKEGMEFMGTVRNVIDFGVFVDIGVHEDGLVHISQICNRYIKHPLEAVKVGEIVKVRVLSVDVKKKRISLTMRLDEASAARNFTEEERKRIPYFYMHSGLNYEKMSPVEKMMMKMLKKMLAGKADKTEEDLEMERMIAGSFDECDKSYIDPLVEYVKNLEA